MTAMLDETPQSLADLITDGPLACTVSLPVGDGRTALRRSRLLGVDEGGVRVETVTQDRDVVRRMIDGKLPILVTVRPPDGERLFYSIPLHLQAGGDGVDAADVTTLAIPDKVLQTQRRSYFRVPINPGDDVQVRAWKINNYVLVRDRALPSQECFCELLDLGAGGMRVAVRARGQHALNLAEDQRFKIELTTSRKTMTLEGRLRYPRVTNRDDVMALCGIRFVHRDTIESRANLQYVHALLAQLQRTAVRNRAA